MNKKSQADKNYNFMKRVVKDLSYSQGSYGRLLSDLLEIEQNAEQFGLLKSRLPDFKDAVDVIFFIEG